MKRMCALVGTNTPTLPDAPLNPFINDFHIHRRTVNGHIHGGMAAPPIMTIAVFNTPTTPHGEHEVTGLHYFPGLRADDGSQLLR